jgi:hypothetical protein
MMRRKQLAIAVMGILSLVAINTVGTAAGAGSDPAFACVVVNVDNCTVTIPLTSNMDEQVGSTMPDTQQWYLSEGAGVGPYGLTGEGNPNTTWNGVAGAMSGSVWSALLTTNANEPAGSAAVLTFSHVTPTTTTTTSVEPYQSISYRYPYRAADGSVATITAVVRPVPAKGDLVLQRKSGSNWVNAGVLSYSLHAKKWTIELRWKFPKHATESFRLLAVAAPGLSATHSGSFKISTLP